MKRVIVVGGGFAGLTALSRLSRYRRGLEIILIDQNKTSGFLPLLPDIIGRKINPDYLSYNLITLSENLGFKFMITQVEAIDLEKKIISTTVQSLPFDYLIIASGSQTNFYNNPEIKKYAYKLDDVSDAVKIHNLLEEDRFDCYLVCGGGYTGVEVATNLWLYWKGRAKNKRIMIVEQAGDILGPLPNWMKLYVKDNLSRLKIECLTNSAIVKLEADKVALRGGKAFDKTMVIWTAGVKAADFIQKLQTEKNPQGRIKVDAYLRLNDSCFVVGDAANVAYSQGFLRMAVQFAITQGDLAGVNVINSLQGRALRQYKPNDLGYIIPLANNRSCGQIFGMNLRGFLPTAMHYLMCIYRTHSFKNRLGIMTNLLQGGGRWIG